MLIYYLFLYNKKISRKRTRALEACPQKKGVCRKMVIVTPKKPNSALRKVAKIKFNNKKIIILGGSVATLFFISLNFIFFKKFLILIMLLFLIKSFSFLLFFYFLVVLS
jgi:hypothetical protein